MLKTFVAFLCMCFAAPVYAKLGETVAQLVKRFGKSYTVEDVELGKTYKFRSENVSVDVVVANGRSISETYFSDHPLTASGEPPNDIVRAVLKTNAPKARWVEIDAAPLGADYALRSSDDKYIAILRYTGPQPENSVWIMTVGLANSVRAPSSVTSPSLSPSPPTSTAIPTPSPSLTTQANIGRRIYADIDQWIAEALFNTGLSYYLGQGVPTDYDEAVKWFRKAAEQNYPPAQSVLGDCYIFGRGVQKDYTQAVKWYRKAAEQNDAVAQNNLGVRYANGQGVAKDLSEAVKWFRRAAEQNNEAAQCNLAVRYVNGQGVAKDLSKAVKWFRRAAEQGYAPAQFSLGNCYYNGEGVRKDYAEAVKWYRKAAEENHRDGQLMLGLSYDLGQGVVKDEVEAIKWYRKAAEQNLASAQYMLGRCYASGQGVAKDYAESYKWMLLASGQGDKDAKEFATILENNMSREQIAEGQRLARNFKPREVPPAGSMSNTEIVQTRPESSGSGFFITDDGILVTNEHVVKDAVQIRLVASAGLIPAKLLKVDSANDIALLKAEGTFAALPVAVSRTVRLGSTVATVGFPNIGLQGFSPKFARGEISSLSGPQDDARYFQISVPVQPGNSGGALVDERGNVVGVVSAALSAKAALAATGALPQNVNYAVKSSFLLGFLESMPDVAAKLKEPNTKDVKFDDVVEQAKEAAVLVLVY